jgi:hypothetical protein
MPYMADQRVSREASSHLARATTSEGASGTRTTCSPRNARHHALNRFFVREIELGRFAIELANENTILINRTLVTEVPCLASSHGPQSPCVLLFVLVGLDIDVQRAYHDESAIGPVSGGTRCDALCTARRFSIDARVGCHGTTYLCGAGGIYFERRPE